MSYFCTKKGYFTGCIVGFLNSIYKLVNTYRPRYCLIVFDHKGKNFRHILYYKYKLGRRKLYFDLSNQINDLFIIINSIGIPFLVMPNIETDDIIGSLSNKMQTSKVNVVIISNDKDFNQLINKKIIICSHIKKLNTNFTRLKSNINVKPNQILDYLCLVGDLSDNLPGVQTIGTKTAKVLLKNCKAFNKILFSRNEIKDKISILFRSNRNKLFFCKKIIEIKKTLQMPLGPLHFIIKEPDVTTLCRIFEYMEFRRTFYKKILDSFYKKKKQFITLTKKLDIYIFLKNVLKKRCFFINYVRMQNKLNFFLEKNIIGIIVFIGCKKTYYMPLSYSNSSNYNHDILLKTGYFFIIKSILETTGLIEFSHELISSVKTFSKYGIKVKNVLFKAISLSIVSNVFLRKNFTSETDTMELMVALKTDRINKLKFFQNFIKLRQLMFLEKYRLIRLLTIQYEHNAINMLIELGIFSIVHIYKTNNIDPLVDINRLITEKNTLIRHKTYIKNCRQNSTNLIKYLLNLLKKSP